MDELNTVLAKAGGWKSVGFAVAVVVVLLVLKRLFSAAPVEKDDKRRVVCSCGWQGQVTRLKPRCPVCGKSETLHDA
jgi:hypothetical protein